MLTHNLWAEAGLVHGAPGTVKQIVFPDGVAPPALPAAVIVHFPDYTGPSFVPPGADSDEWDHCVPVLPVTGEFTAAGRIHSRRQLPLRLRYAMTVHKSQGATLDKVYIDLGDKETTPGLTFVAMSRVRRVEDLYIHPGMSLQRIASIGAGNGVQERKVEERRVRNVEQ